MVLRVLQGRLIFAIFRLVRSYWNVIVRGAWHVIWTWGRYMRWRDWLGFSARIGSNTWWIPLVVALGFFFVQLTYYYFSQPYPGQLCPW